VRTVLVRTGHDGFRFRHREIQQLLGDIVDKLGRHFSLACEERFACQTERRKNLAFRTTELRTVVVTEVEVRDIAKPQPLLGRSCNANLHFLGNVRDDLCLEIGVASHHQRERAAVIIRSEAPTTSGPGVN
jgi:hypothetical protein